MKTPHAIFLACLITFLTGCASSHIICDGRVVVNSKEKIKFSKNEEPLLCGDIELKPWKDVPLAQTEMTMKEFLKGRGFYNSTFELKDEKLQIDTGKSYKVKKVNFINAPKEFREIRFVGWKNQDFTSGTLDNIEAWTLKRLKALGYACAELKTQAVIETQTVEVHINLGHKYTFPEMTYVPEKSLDPRIMQRFYAFHTGDDFNEDLMSLSSKRMETDSVVSHSNFLTNCEETPENDKDEKKLTIKHVVNKGTSHLFQVGAGASTEEYPILKAGWKDSRIDRHASILSATLYASQLRQTFQTAYEWHFSNDYARWFMMPTVLGQRVDDEDQTYYLASLFTPLGARLDSKALQFEFKTGPLADFENASDGPTTGEKAFGMWKSSFEVSSHDYEVYMNEPRRGFRIYFETSSILLTSADNVHANKVSLSGAKLWNLLNYGPPKYVLGVRFGVDSVVTPNPGTIRAQLPQEYFTWLGGDTSIRGFSRREIPVDEIGSEATAYTGLEMRFVSAFINNLDPFIFTDVGVVGEENFDFDTSIFWSPGIGLRYQSPIGVIRTTGAHGFISRKNFSFPVNRHEHYQFFVSLGREF